MIGHYSQLAHQGIADPSRSMRNGGGGGGDTPDTRYANLDALYGVQKQASEYMLNNAMPHIPGLTQNSATMVGEATNGTLAKNLRNSASYDANEAVASSNADAIRSLTKYGAVGDPSSGRFADVVNQNAINSAKTRAGAMNKANMAAEDQKWNRNANFYGQIMGMNNGAMQGMSSAGAGMSGVAGAQSANDAANAAGLGKAGSAFASSFTSKADGGYIKAPKLASGGDAWEAYKKANPVQASSGSGKRTSGLKAMLGGAAPQLLGAGLKDVFSDKSKIIGGAKKVYDTGKSAYDTWQAAQAAQEYANAAQVINDGVTAATATADALDAASAGVDAVDAASNSVDAMNMAGAGADAMSAASDAASVADTASNSVDAMNFATLFSKGGVVKKPNAYALGGLAKNGVVNSSVVDNQSVAKMDASRSMSVAKMDDAPSKSMETHAKSPQGQFGKTDGMGEGSSNDPDGFGKKSADLRHLGGKAVMSYFIPGGSLLAEAVHPMGEAVSRALVTTGDKIGRALTGNSRVGGAVGAFALDPIGSLLSGKYLAKGGRVDRTDGGNVDGPGTETSDDIPAWLSDGEFVLNAEAVKMVGKDKLEQINNAGLKKRDGGVKLAGGGFLGGNLGIAMGAGVDEWNRQKVNDRADKADTRQQETHAAQMKEIERRNAELAAAGKVWQGAQSVFQGGSDAAAQSLLERYNANDAGMGYNDGHTARLEKTDKGYVVTRTAPDGKVVGSQAFTPQQVRQEHMRSVYSQLAGINPAYGEKLMGFLESQNKEETRKGERAEDMAHRDKREGVTDGHWDKNFGLQKQQVANSGFGNSLAQQRLDMAKEEHASGAPDRQLKSTLSTLNLALLNAGTPEERKPIVEKINSLQSIAGMDKDAPSEVKLANSLVKYGVFPDVGSALKFTTSSKDMSPDALRAKVYTAALTANMGNTKKAQETTNESMKFLVPGAASKPAPQNITAADITATAQKYGISEDEVKKRLGLK